VSSAPTKRLAGLVLVLAGTVAVLALSERSVGGWPGLLVLGLVALVDLVALRRTAQPVVTTQLEPTAMLRRPLELVVAASGSRVTDIAVGMPHELGGPLPLVRAGRRSRLEAKLSATPRRRGSHAIGEVWVTSESPLGLWRRRRVVPSSARVHVLPDLRGPADDPLGKELASDGERQAIGLLPGAGELKGLRPFQSGDDRRHVDWKATARTSVPIVREWQPDRRRSLMVVLDAGRLMRAEHEGESKFDAALRALGRLALAAETWGDRVGAVVYADKPLRHVPPLFGAGQAGRLLRFVADLEPASVESDLAQAMPFVLGHARRSLVVVVTDVVDAAGGAALLNPVVHLARQHVPIVVLLRDPSLDDALSRPIIEPKDAYVRAAADLVAKDRDEALVGLRARGVRALDLSMRSLALEVVQRYLEVRRGL
jgi:uncharacterized protein (DUF58 family)